MASLGPKYSKAAKQRARAYMDFVNSRIEPLEEASRDFRAIIQHPGLLMPAEDEYDGERPYGLEDEDSYFIEFGPLQHDDLSSVTDAEDQQPLPHGGASPEIVGVGVIYQSQNGLRSTTPPGDPDVCAIPHIFCNTATHLPPDVTLSSTPQGSPNGGVRPDLVDATELFQAYHTQIQSLTNFTSQLQSAPRSTTSGGVPIDELRSSYPYDQASSDNFAAALAERHARDQIASEQCHLSPHIDQYDSSFTSDHAVVANFATTPLWHIELAGSSEPRTPAYNPDSLQPVSTDGRLPSYPINENSSSDIQGDEHLALATPAWSHPIDQVYPRSRQGNGHKIENNIQTVSPQPTSANSTSSGNYDKGNQSMRHEARTCESQQAARKRPCDETPINDRTQRARLGGFQDASNSITRVSYSERYPHGIFWEGIEIEHIEYHDDETEQDLEQENNGGEQSRANGPGSIANDSQHNERNKEENRNKDDELRNPKVEDDFDRPPSRLRTHTVELSNDFLEPGSRPSSSEDAIFTHRPGALYPLPRRSQSSSPAQAASSYPTFLPPPMYPFSALADAAAASTHLPLPAYASTTLVQASSTYLPPPAYPFSTLAQAASIPLPRDSVASLNTNPSLEEETPNIMPYGVPSSPEYAGQPKRDTSESSQSAAPDSLPDLVPSSPGMDEVMYEIELDSIDPNRNPDEDEWVSISTQAATEEEHTYARFFSYPDPDWMGIPLAAQLHSALRRPEPRRELHAASAQRLAEAERARADGEQDGERAGNGGSEEAEDSWVEVQDAEAERTYR